MQEVEVKLSGWVFKALHAQEVLALSREHVRLRKPLERRISEPACKHCGRQKEWRMPMAVLHRKGGSGSTLRELRRLVLAIAKEDEEYRHMPGYQNCIEDVKVQLVARSRGTLGDDRSDAVEIPALDPESYDMPAPQPRAGTCMSSKPNAAPGPAPSRAIRRWPFSGSARKGPSSAVRGRVPKRLSCVISR